MSESGNPEIADLIQRAQEGDAECREQLFEIRAAEMKRSVSWVVEKLNKRENGPELVGADLDNESPRA